MTTDVRCCRDMLYVVVGGQQRLELDHAGFGVNVEVDIEIANDDYRRVGSDALQQVGELVQETADS